MARIFEREKRELGLKSDAGKGKMHKKREGRNGINVPTGSDMLGAPEVRRRNYNCSLKPLGESLALKRTCLVLLTLRTVR